MAELFTEIPFVAFATADMLARVSDTLPHLWNCLAADQSPPVRIDGCPSDTALSVSLVGFWRTRCVVIGVPQNITSVALPKFS